MEPIYFGCFELWRIASIKYNQLKHNLCIDKLIHAKISKNKNLSIEPFYPRVTRYQSLSEEEKEKKRQYYRERNKNLSEEEKENKVDEKLLFSTKKMYF